LLQVREFEFRDTTPVDAGLNLWRDFLQHAPAGFDEDRGAAADRREYGRRSRRAAMVCSVNGRSFCICVPSPAD
jgi:hypothetical protein